MILQGVITPCVITLKYFLKAFLISLVPSSFVLRMPSLIFINSLHTSVKKKKIEGRLSGSIG